MVLDLYMLQFIIGSVRDFEDELHYKKLTELSKSLNLQAFIF
jgi:hypothetical protein